MANAPTCEAASGLRGFLERHPRLFVLTGAGVSTDSGIPAYRDADGRWQRSPPVFLQDFLGSAAARRRYWARSMRGWPFVTRARPNAAHVALAGMQAAGRIERLVTQNVDGLHQRAGSEDVIELHGSLRMVECLDCGTTHSRQSIQHELEALNAAVLDARAQALPDGDADIDPQRLDEFRVPSCSDCGGMLKPSVVFFGEGVPRQRVERAKADLQAADALLVVGSSLKVYSGYRFCEWAHAAGKPIAAVNHGITRADHLLALKLEQSCGDALREAMDACVAGSRIS